MIPMGDETQKDLVSSRGFITEKFTQVEQKVAEGVNVARACRMVGLSKDTYYYRLRQKKKGPEAATSEAP
jgi:hypothetical protein